MSCFLGLIFVGQFIFDTVGVWDIKGEVSIDGGAFTTIAIARYGTFPGLIGLPAVLPAFDQFNLAAGAARTYALRMSVQTVVGSGPLSVFSSFAMSAHAIGTTRE